MISLSDLSSKLKKEKSVALICHIRPDGDTLGSALALSIALNNLGIVSDVYCDDSVPSRFFFLNSTKLVKKEIDNQKLQRKRILYGEKRDEEKKVRKHKKMVINIGDGCITWWLF